MKTLKLRSLEIKRNTHCYHWPMKESEINDKYNNLYAKGGGLNKYDQLFNTKSSEYQKKTIVYKEIQ